MPSLRIFLERKMLKNIYKCVPRELILAFLLFSLQSSAKSHSKILDSEGDTSIERQINLSTPHDQHIIFNGTSKVSTSLL